MKQLTSRTLVADTIRGIQPRSITPMYAWVFDNVVDRITQQYGSMHAFEDRWQFDLAHIFGGPKPFDTPEIRRLVKSGRPVTPDMLLELPMTDPDDNAAYESARQEILYQQGQRGRFCYMQTNGIFECLNDVFGIEDHLCYMLTYEDELAQLYRRLADWNCRYIHNIVDMGVDMVHISDDWGAQNNLLFSPALWRSMIYPHHKRMVEQAKKHGAFASLHSDGNINLVLDGIVELGYDVLHPYQETAGMSYQTYLSRYADRFAILGGVCVQSVLGFGNYERLEQEIRRVFRLLRGRRWICCTTHLVQPHCSMQELEFALDLMLRLSGKQ